MIRACAIPSLADKRKDIPAKLCATIHKGLTADPEQRFPSARYMANELGDVLRECDWGDGDGIVAAAVGESRASLQQLPIGP